jgi:hypothetical protein
MWNNYYDNRESLVTRVVYIMSRVGQIQRISNPQGKINSLLSQEHAVKFSAKNLMQSCSNI